MTRWLVTPISVVQTRIMIARKISTPMSGGTSTMPGYCRVIAQQAEKDGNDERAIGQRVLDPMEMRDVMHRLVRAETAFDVAHIRSLPATGSIRADGARPAGRGNTGARARVRWRLQIPQGTLSSPADFCQAAEPGLRVRRRKRMAVSP